MGGRVGESGGRVEAPREGKDGNKKQVSPERQKQKHRKNYEIKTRTPATKTETSEKLRNTEKTFK